MKTDNIDIYERLLTIEETIRQGSRKEPYEELLKLCNKHRSPWARYIKIKLKQENSSDQEVAYDLHRLILDIAFPEKNSYQSDITNKPTNEKILHLSCRSQIQICQNQQDDKGVLDTLNVIIMYLSNSSDADLRGEATEAYLKTANIYTQKGDYEQAIATLEECISVFDICYDESVFGNVATAHQNLAEIYPLYDTKNGYHKSLELYDNIIKKCQQTKYNSQAHTDATTAKLAELFNPLPRIIAESYYKKGLLYLNIKKYEDAKNCYNSAIEEAKDNASLLDLLKTAYLYKAITALKTSDPKKAIYECKKALDVETPLYFWRADIDWIEKQFEKLIYLEDCLKCEIYLSLHYLNLATLQYDPDTFKADTSQIRHLYHYTTISALRSILPVSNHNENKNVSCPSNHLRISNLEYFNDPQEGSALIQHCQNCNECGQKYISHFFDIDQIAPELSSGIFIVSFTSEKDRLDLWRMYSQNANGVSIGMPMKIFNKSVNGLLRYSKNKLTLKSSVKILMGRPIPVLYNSKDKTSACNSINDEIKYAFEVSNKIKDEKAKEIYNTAVQGLLLNVLYSCKSEEYENEKEYRYIVFQPNLSHAEIDQEPIADGKSPRIFLKTKSELFQSKGHEIYIGPRVENKNLIRLELEYRLAKHGFSDNVVIKESEHEYR